MTREERALRNLKQMCSDGRYLGSGSYAPLEVLEDFSTAIKALEQETVSKEVYDHEYFLRKEFEIKIARLEHEKNGVLDKIRAELHATAEMHEDGDYYLRDEWIDEYFDKYKAESEK